MVGKQHFTLLYDRARNKALTSRNIISGWSKTGLRPFNPEKVLKDIQKPELNTASVPAKIKKPCDFLKPQLKTLTTSESLISFRRRIKESIAQGGELDSSCKIYIQKVANTAENVFADRAILLDKNLLLFEQNNKKTTRKSMKATVVGSARVMSYEDIVEAQQKRDMKMQRLSQSDGDGSRSVTELLHPKL